MDPVLFISISRYRERRSFRYIGNYAYKYIRQKALLGLVKFLYTNGIGAIIMSQAKRLTTLNMDSETIIAHLTRWLAYHGLRIVRGFDLQSACASFADKICPHHGDYPCDCQLVVLLVYRAGDSPASILLHTHRNKTDVDLIDSPNNHPSQQLEKIIRMVIEKILDAPPLLNVEINTD